VRLLRLGGLVRPVRLTLVTERPVLGNVRANLETVARHVRAAEGDLVLFGELFLQGYTARDHFHRTALSVQGDEFDALKKLCRETKKSLLVGFARRDDERRGVLYDSAALVTKKGRVDVYDKWFLANFGPFEEKLYFAPGHRLNVWELDGVRLGVQICYDLFFPELTKAYALMGADVLVNLSASPTTSRANFERLFPARALETGCFFAYCNVAGAQDEVVFWGGSQVWGPRGDEKVKAPTLDPSVVTVDLSMDEVEAARPLRPTVRDTRREMVDALAQGFNTLQR
jgi:5-aminopentanamidase